MKHTKGPWKSQLSKTGKKYKISGNYWVNFCRVWAHTGDEKSKIEAAANVKLIVAAPELLETLQHALSIVDLWSPNPSLEDIIECDVSEFAALSNMRSNIEGAIKKATE